jgi:hypothetical protein
MKIVNAGPMGRLQFLIGLLFPSRHSANGNLNTHCWNCDRRIRVGETRCPCGYLSRW